MNSFIDALHERRRLLQNPYAFATELAEQEDLRQDRLRLENPYAHADAIRTTLQQIRRFDGISVGDKAPVRRRRQRLSDSELEEFVRNIQVGLWERRLDLLGSDYSNPLAILDPTIVLRDHGYEVVAAESLGQFGSSEGMFEVAGSIDRKQRRVHVSTQFPRDVQMFTLAHELGHALLHEGTSLHRDRGLDGTFQVRDPDEREANRFATFFLMPSKQVRRAFEERFGSRSVRFDERATFERVHKRADVRRMAGRRLASSDRHQGVSFTPLADLFQVSVEAMAIRLEELGLFVLTGNLPGSKR